MEISYKEVMTQIDTFVFDVDGVLTDGVVTVTTSGELIRNMHTKDGFALKQAVNAGYRVCVITGGTNEGIRMRLNGLGVKDVYLGAHQKTNQFEEYVSMYNIDTSKVLYMGDDLPDYPVMKTVGLPCCPKDAVMEIKDMSLYVSQKRGGKGCVRDVIEQVMKVQGKWNRNYSARYD